MTSLASSTYPLTIIRNKGWFGRVRTLAILADGQKIGEIKSGDTVQIEVPNSAKELYGKMDWGKSERLDLTFVEPNETVYVNHRFTLNPLRNLAIIKIPVRFEMKPH